MPSVCARCIEEKWLVSYIGANASENECDYCERKSKHKIAVPLHELTPHVIERIECLFENPANSVGYDSSEGGYQLSTTDSYDVLEDVGLGVDNDELRQDLVEVLPNYEWVRRHPYSLPEEDALRLSWEEFSRLVKHRVRYLLFSPEQQEHDQEGVSPGDMLNEIGDLFAQHGLVSTLEAGTHLFRVRIHKPSEAPANTCAALGPPPIESATFSNRMSPAGISMFYVALDEATARAETYVRHDGKPAVATIATFELIEDLMILNLAELPDIPSVFADDEANLERPAILFLHEFVADLTQPVDKDGREHIEYVPSQVVTEYVRYRLSERIEGSVMGILYPSARRSGGIGCVLFVAHEDVNAAILPDKAPFNLLTEFTKTAAVTARKKG